MTRPTNDPVTEQAKRLAERLRKREALKDMESILQTLAVGERDLVAFSAIGSDSDGEHSAQSNYRSNHDTSESPEDNGSENISMLEPETTKPASQVNETGLDEQVPTPPHNQVETQEEQAPLPPPESSKKQEEWVLTPSPANPIDNETMTYQYSKYWDDPDAEAHIYAFLQTWEVNHVSQRLNEAEAERSKIAEFGMTLEGQATQWPSKHLPGSIDTFEELKTRCLRFFHRQVDQREIVGQFYTTRQDPIETIQQFVIRFQKMHSQFTRAPPEEEAKAVFLAALREPLRTMCAVIDFQTSTVD